jgi:hypothetical protein
MLNQTEKEVAPYYSGPLRVPEMNPGNEYSENKRYGGSPAGGRRFPALRGGNREFFFYPKTAEIPLIYHGRDRGKTGRLHTSAKQPSSPPKSHKGINRGTREGSGSVMHHHENIVLIGMPGAGKSTVGVVLA